MNRSDSYSRLLWVKPVGLDPSSETNLKGESVLLGSVTWIDEEIFLVPLAIGLTKDASLGKLMAGLETDDKGAFKLEVGAVLPIWLPDLCGQRDFAIDIPVGDDAPVRLAFSNQMMKLRFKKADYLAHILVPRYHLEKFLESEDLPEGFHLEPCKTMAAARFTVVGADAEEALEKNIAVCQDRFIHALNMALESHLELATNESPILAARLDLGNFDTIYITMQGSNPKEAGVAPYHLSWYIARSPREYTAEETSRFLALAEGTETIGDARRLLNAGKSLIESASREFAFLQIMIAVEIATMRAVYGLLKRSGVSQTVLNDYDSELKFGQSLNLHLVSLCPPNLKPDKATVGRINWGRKLRNTLMHEAKFSATRQQLLELHGAASAFLDFLAEVERSTGEKGTEEVRT